MGGRASITQYSFFFFLVNKRLNSRRKFRTTIGDKERMLQGICTRVLVRENTIHLFRVY